MPSRPHSEHVSTFLGGSGVAVAREPFFATLHHDLFDSHPVVL